MNDATNTKTILKAIDAAGAIDHSDATYAILVAATDAVVEGRESDARIVLWQLTGRAGRVAEKILTAA